MKKLIIILCLLCLFGCATNKPIQKQEWFPQYIQNEIDALEEELIGLITLLEKEKITIPEYEYLSHLRFDYFRIRISGEWIKDKSNDWNWIKKKMIMKSWGE